MHVGVNLNFSLASAPGSQPTSSNGQGDAGYADDGGDGDEAPAAPLLDLPNQRVIRADIERTRPHLPQFQNPETKAGMERILTAYCHRQRTSYKQGMNYLLAPFFLVGLPELHAVYRCFAAFLDRFLPATFADDDFGALQCIFRLFRLLLLYHDPELCSFLDQYEMTPEVRIIMLTLLFCASCISKSCISTLFLRPFLFVSDFTFSCTRRLGS